ncbi:ImmA/IrrE family metallo-endopeptidase [Methylobacterium sp. J-072]|uniref:ImmA/IrrE family metallo-endopeptidase n=1 Tax=Methylobacterium sp. J-072 TaxID=2836651 RepID=UPI001FB9C9F2|nr:ImmA/IrrE family metallo-endopeptidase [Methylobacterium sp. J-072]MCJ2090965.1 ImmA/IrrE family metallo-endopeptidase [Methylobacterium sp. J-072]
MPVPLRRGFKSDANWHAIKAREELGLLPHAALCPRNLAIHLGYTVVELGSYIAHDASAVHYLQSAAGQKEFSAITIYCEVARLIIHNDAHHPHRQAANIAHELAHGLLIHKPSALQDRNGARLYNKEQEDEANWLGPALLISDEAALHIVETGQSHAEARRTYGVSDELLEMRLRVTAAHLRVARRRAA